MSTLAEIQEAITHLPDEDRKALALWMNSQTTAELSAADEERLLQSLDQAAVDLEAGRGLTLEQVRKLVPTWAAR